MRDALSGDTRPHGSHLIVGERQGANGARFERYLTAYNHRDVDGMLATRTEDVEFEHVSGGSSNVHISGRKAFRELARGTAGVFKSRSLMVTFAVRDGDAVAVTVAFLGTVANDIPNGWRSGQRVKLRSCTFFRLRDDATTRSAASPTSADPASARSESWRPASPGAA